MANKTKEITYNLYERGRKYTGIDRNNMNVPLLVKMINSPAVQEMVKLGQLHGYYGHQIRALYGMTPPETMFVNGKTIRLEPAFKTIYLKAKDNGDVSHVAEFYNNDSGEFAKRQYQAGVGGFSTAISCEKIGMSYNPTGFYGFDYVTQQNYYDNMGDGQLFDSATARASEREQQLLREQIVMQFDSIHQQLQLIQANEHSLDLIQEQERQLQRESKRRALREQREKEMRTGIKGTISSFDSAVQDANDYLRRLDDLNQQQAKSEPSLDIPFGVKG